MLSPVSVILFGGGGERYGGRVRFVEILGGGVCPNQVTYLLPLTTSGLGSGKIP